MTVHRQLIIPAATACLATVLIVGCAHAPATATQPTVQPAAPTATKLPNDIRWYRTSAEMRALYVQAYQVATERMITLSAGRAAGTWAVILDADETVLNNSAYQESVVGTGYDSTTWKAWVLKREATALPGSVAFVKAVHDRGGRVAIVTNRESDVCGATRENLQQVGLIVDAVLCKTTTSDKNPRFALVATGAQGMPRLDVLLWVGDNIQDFPNLTQAATRSAADATFADFGRRFVVLPNPMYGSWESR